jgi:hypothetical protein
MARAQGWFQPTGLRGPQRRHAPRIGLRMATGASQ